MTDTRVHAFCADALGHDDACAVADRIASGEISAEEATEAAIARIAKVNPLLHAVELENYDAARGAARQPLTGGFAGVPSVIKDNVDLRGLPTNHGSRAVNALPAKADGAFARQYLAQGFVIVAKSSLPEFGFNATTEFAEREATRNPWHTGYSSGASSGGSAALVAAGAVPIGHANDGGGSIRIPAACCGLVGLKPTRGRLVDGESARSLPVNIVSEGVVSRSVRDQARFYAEAERYFSPRKLPRVGMVEGPASHKLRIGLVLDSITGHATCDDTRKAVLETARRLEGLGHTVEEMPLPVTPQFAEDFTFYWGFLAFMVSTFGHRMMSPHFDRDQLEGLSVGLAGIYRKNMLKTPMVLWRLKRTWKEYAASMRRYDAVLSPVLAHTTPELGHLNPEVSFETLLERLLRYVSFTPLHNASGSPAISLPLGADSRGLPIGVMLSAAHGDERTLLELAYALEAEQPFRRIDNH